ncbi:MAG: Hsp70 family protein [Methanospirillum sp.]
MIYFGIDFGTSNSCIAYYDDVSGKKEAIRPNVHEFRMRGGRVTPSAVGFDQDGNLISSGYFAHACGQFMGSSVVDKVKLWIGRPYLDVMNDGRMNNLPYSLEKSGNGMPIVRKADHTYTAEDLVSYFLKSLVDEAYAYLRKTGGLRNTNATVIVTYPAYYVQNQVDAIRDAVEKMVSMINSGQQADDGRLEIEAFKLIPEPLATVCLAIADKKIDRDDNYVLVVDMGAGTLDVMLVNINEIPIDLLKKDQVAELKASGVTIGGMEKLGGVDMDNAIIGWLDLQLRRDGYDLTELNEIDKNQLMANVEDAKIALSVNDTQEAQIQIPKFQRVVPLSQKTLADLIKPIIDDCASKVDWAIKEIETKNLDFKRDQISALIFVGGPTQMQIFADVMRTCIQVAPIEGIHPMECVALGAAVSPTVNYDVPVERTYGLIQGTGESEKFVKIIEKDTPLPASKIVKHRTGQFEGRISIEVAQVYAEDSDSTICMKMGRYDYHVHPRAADYFVVFRIDEERKIDVVVTESQSKAEEYIKGATDPTLWHIQIVRETDELPSSIPKEKLSEDSRKKFEALLPVMPEIFRVFYNGIEQSHICEAILSYSVPEDVRRRLVGLKIDVDDGVTWINLQLNELINEIELGDGRLTVESAKKSEEKAKEIRESQRYRDLIVSAESLRMEFEAVRDEVSYSEEDVAELLERISRTQYRAAEILRSKNSDMSSPQFERMRTLMQQLDKAKKELEKVGEPGLLVVSPGGKMFRDAASQEQVLKSMVDQE